MYSISIQLWAECVIGNISQCIFPQYKGYMEFSLKAKLASKHLIMYQHLLRKMYA